MCCYYLAKAGVTLDQLEVSMTKMYDKLQSKVDYGYYLDTLLTELYPFDQLFDSNPLMSDLNKKYEKRFVSILYKLHTKKMVWDNIGLTEAKFWHLGTFKNVNKVLSDMVNNYRGDTLKRLLCDENHNLIENNTKITTKKQNIETIPTESKVDLKKAMLLDRYLLGQNDAVKTVKDKLWSASVGFRDENKPIASFLLTGPSGVGKTETAKTVAKLCFDNKIHIIDMTSFKGDADVSRLVGGSPNYVGYSDRNDFLDFIDNNVSGVLLFDEIEKASKGCLDLLLRMFDEGEIIDAKSHTHSVKNMVIFCTTNLTQDQMYLDDCPIEERLTLGKYALRKEFVGRFDNVVEYKHLGKDACKEITQNILDKSIQKFSKQTKYNIGIKYDDGLVNKIIKNANMELFGARGIKTAVQNIFINPVSEYIITNDIKDTTIFVKENQIINNVSSTHKNKSI